MNEQRKNAIWLILVVGVVVTIIASNRDRTDDELAGVWKLESTQTNGQPERRARELWVFRHGTLTIVRDDDSHQAKISVDPTASPKHLNTDTIFRPTGIYEIDGDTLRIAQVLPKMPRPTEFHTAWGDMRTVSVFRRVDADTRMSTNEFSELLQSEFGPATKYPERIEFDAGAEKFVSGLMREMYDKAGEMTPKEEVVYHISRLIAGVNNGGFHQFFFNSAGDNAAGTAALLRVIGAPETATLVETGCKLFPEAAPSKDLQKRRSQLERLS